MALSQVLTIFGVLAFLGGVSLAVWFTDSNNQRVVDTERLNNLTFIADFLALEASEDLFFGNTDRVRRKMGEVLTTHPQVRDAILVNAEDGVVIYDLVGRREGQPYDESMARKSMMYVKRDIVWQGGRFFELGLDKKELATLYLGLQPGTYLEDMHATGFVAFAKSVAERCSAAVEKGEWVIWRDYASAMASNLENVLYTELLLPDGEVLYHQERGLSDEENRTLEGRRTNDPMGRTALTVTPERPVRVLRTQGKDGQQIMDIAVPVLVSNEVRAVVRVGYSVEHFERHRRQSQRTLTLITIGILVAGALIALGVSARMGKLVKQVEESERTTTRLFKEKQRELQAALRVQRSLLPAFQGKAGDLAVTGHYESAEELCGDFFDYRINDRYMAVLLADVSGHGASAAMVTTTLKIFFNEIIDEAGHYEPPSPEHILIELDARLGRVIAEDLHYATGICLVLDIQEHRLTYCRAGHAAPLVMDAQGRFTEQPNTGLPALNLFSLVGIFTENQDVVVPLEPGTRVLVFTDGLEECMNTQREQWGMERFQRTLTMNAHLDGPGLLQAVSETCREFADENTPQDDQCMVLMERLLS